MDSQQARSEIQRQINALAAERDDTQDSTEKAALNAAISKLQDARSEIDIEDTDEIAARFDALISDLDDIRTERGLDAVSILGRVIRELRDGRLA